MARIVKEIWIFEQQGGPLGFLQKLTPIHRLEAAWYSAYNYLLTLLTHGGTKTERH